MPGLGPSLQAIRLARDIHAQGASLRRAFDWHRGEGAQPLQAAATLIGAAKRTVLVGIGASYNAALPLETLLCAHGREAILVEAGELLHYRREAYRDATFVLVSRSGESIEITKLLAALGPGASIVALTNEPASTLARAATVALDMHSLADEMVAIQSYAATLLTLYLLGMSVVGQSSRARTELDQLLPAFDHWVESNLREPSRWDAFLLRDAPLYTLGRGPSYGSALQGALLFGEVAKAPAVGMAAATFRHGPIEVVDAQFRGLIFAPQGRSRELNIALAEDIARFGGNVRLIGPELIAPEDKVHGAVPWITTPSCPEMLAPLVEVVPLQVAALRLAQLRGVVVGSFRFAPQVTRDEARIGN